jgi:hypothetical protein
MKVAVGKARLRRHNDRVRRARILAFFLDVLLCAFAADLAGLGISWAVWSLFPGFRGSLPLVWAGLGSAALAAFLLRDAGGGRARRWLALEAVGGDGLPASRWASIRRNLPLLVPGWNIFDAWPVFRDGQAPRRCDRAVGTRIVGVS